MAGSDTRGTTLTNRGLCIQALPCPRGVAQRERRYKKHYTFHHSSQEPSRVNHRPVNAPVITTPSLSSLRPALALLSHAQTPPPQPAPHHPCPDQ